MWAGKTAREGGRGGCLWRNAFFLVCPYMIGLFWQLLSTLRHLLPWLEMWCTHEPSIDMSLCYTFYSVYAATQVQHFYRVRVATAVGKAWRNQLGIKKRRKFNCVRPKIPESWLSKHPPGYLKSQLCEKVQISQSRALLCYLKFWYLYSLNAHLLKPCMKAFADQQIWTVKNGK